MSNQALVADSLVLANNMFAVERVHVLLLQVKDQPAGSVPKQGVFYKKGLRPRTENNTHQRRSNTNSLR